MSGMETDILMLFDGLPAEFALYKAVEDKIMFAFSDARIKVSKTQVGFKTSSGFAWVWMPRWKMKDRPEHYVVLTFGLDHEEKSPRIFATVNPYKNRWTHHFILSDPAQLDAEVMGWLAEAHAFSKVRRGRG